MKRPTESELALRRSLGCFATGVTVITCCAHDGRACGITANSFSSVSLDPPLILWNIARVSNSLQACLDAEHFAIHVLKSSQRHLAEQFARPVHTIFDGVEYEISADRVPILEDSLARFDCRTDTIHESGDHYIIVGEVLNHVRSEGEPLLFYAGNYRRF
jgi:flavin reductase (DIM6/NTAB) family NADH-FMN oxidoreductase RutF